MVRRRPCPHHPYEGSQPVRRALGFAGERPLVLITPTRGRNHIPAQIPRRDESSPHHPYEGSQPDAPQVAEADTGPVLITPTRGRNTAAHSASPPTRASPHHPYEGSQHRARVEHAAAGPSPHHPYEGSQLHHHVSGPMAGRVLITPTRGRNCGVEGACRPRSGPHHPYEGSQLRVALVPVLRDARPHHPYEGSQPRYRPAGRPSDTAVLITPTRGRNTIDLTASSGWRTSPHHPYEGSQQGHAGGCPAGPAGIRPHHPYEGSQQGLARR